MEHRELDRPRPGERVGGRHPLGRREAPAGPCQPFEDRLLRVSRALAFCRASTSWSLDIRDLPGMSILLARSIRWVFGAWASTPPAGPAALARRAPRSGRLRVRRPLLVL